MVRFLWRHGPRIWKAVNESRGPEPGTVRHLLGNLTLGVLMGVAYWLVHTHR